MSKIGQWLLEREAAGKVTYDKTGAIQNVRYTDQEERPDAKDAAESPVGSAGVSGSGSLRGTARPDGEQ